MSKQTQADVDRRCHELTKEGSPCKAPPMKGSEYCFQHNPQVAKERAVAKHRGGKARATPPGKPVKLASPEDVREGVARIIGDLWMLRNTAERARALISAYELALKTFEIIELEERIDALESRVADQEAERKEATTLWTRPRAS